MRVQRFATSILLVCSIMLAACVSDTISQQETNQPLAGAGNAVFDPAQRELAVQEIRAKAARSETPELTNAYANGDGPSNPMSRAEQSAGIRELSNAAQQNNTAVPDPELEAKQRSIRQMQFEGQRHYDEALKNIQN